MKPGRIQQFLLLLIPYCFLYGITAHNILFWDTVQFAGDHPNWFYSTHFRYLLLPDYCDSGHPPAFGLYIATIWTLIGRGLFQTHTAMQPFVLMIIWQSVRLGSFLFPANARRAFCIAVIILSQAVLMTQCVLVSPDVLLAAFFLWGLNAVLKKNNTQLVFAVIALSLVSNRAMMVAVCLYIFYCCRYILEERHATPRQWITDAFRLLLYFLPGALLAIAYFSYHYFVKGWIAAPVQSQWRASFSMDPVSSLPSNFVKLCWRMIELGNVATVLLCLYLCFLWARRKLVFTDRAQEVTARSLLVLVVTLFLLTGCTLIYNFRLLAQRYLIPVNITAGVLAVYLLYHSRLTIRRKGILVWVMLLVQLSGHFWTYPRKYSQGWEATLGHLFYYPMRKDFEDYMEEHRIPRSAVATPANMGCADYALKLTTDTVPYPEAGIDTTRYIWYCNVANSMNKGVDYYFRNFEIVKYEKKGHVEMALFRRPQPH